MCSLCITCLPCTLPSLHLVSVVFGTAIATSLYIFSKCFSYLYNYNGGWCGFFHAQCHFPVIKEIFHVQKKDVGIELFVQCLYALSLHIVSVVLAQPSLHPCTFLKNVVFTCNIRESVDSLCRDDADTPIVRVHWKAFLTREYSRFKPFSAREWPIRPLLYPTIPHK